MCEGILSSDRPEAAEHLLEQDRLVQPPQPRQLLQPSWVNSDRRSTFLFFCDRQEKCDVDFRWALSFLHQDRNRSTPTGIFR